MSLSETDTHTSTTPISTLSELPTINEGSSSNTKSTVTKPTTTSLWSQSFSSVPSSDQTPSIRPNVILPRPTATSQSHAELSSQATASSTEPTSFRSSSRTLISTSDAAAETGVVTFPTTRAPVGTTTSTDAVFCITKSQTQCVALNTLGLVDETTTVPLGAPYFATVIMTTASGSIMPVTTLPVRLSVMPTPTRPRTLTVIPTILINSHGDIVATSSVTAQVVPTFSVITDSRGSDTTAPYDLTTLVPPQSGTFYGFTTWTTYTIVDGSTIPLIADQTVVPTTSQGTYIFEPGTKIPLSLASSISVESTRTSLPSETPGTARIGSSGGSKVAGAVVGALVGLTLLGVLVLVSLRNRRKKLAPDSNASQSPIWGSRSVQRSASNSELTLDLDREPSPRASFVEPWTQRPQTQPRSRKMQREMEERGGVIASGPSTIGFSVGHSYDALRPSNSANRVPPELQPEPLMTWPVRNNPLSSIHSAEGSDRGSTQHLSGRSLLAATQPPSHIQFLTLSQLPPPEPIGQPQRDAIPPMYNEAWNIRLAPLSQ